MQFFFIVNFTITKLVYYEWRIQLIMSSALFDSIAIYRSFCNSLILTQLVTHRLVIALLRDLEFKPHSD